MIESDRNKNQAVGSGGRLHPINAALKDDLGGVSKRRPRGSNPRVFSPTSPVPVREDRKPGRDGNLQLNTPNLRSFLGS